MKIKKTVATDAGDAFSTLAETIHRHSDMTQAEKVKAKAHGITADTEHFNAHGNNSRIAIDNGDDHIQITENTYAFDNQAIRYLGRLFFGTVRPAAYHEKRAQDKTTVRKSECIVHSDGLSLLQTAQPNNALAVATTHFTYDAPRRVIHKNRPDGAQVVTEYVVATKIDGTRAKPIYNDSCLNNDFGVVEQMLERVYLAPTPVGGVNSLNHRYEFESTPSSATHPSLFTLLNPIPVLAM